MGGGHQLGEGPQPGAPAQQRRTDRPVRDRVRGQLALGDREVRTADTAGLAGRPEPGHGGPQAGVDLERGRSVGGGPGGRAQLGGQLDLRDQTVADGERVAGDPPLTAGHRAPLGVQPGHRDGGDPVGAVRLDHRAARPQPDAVAQQGRTVPGALDQLGRDSGQHAGAPGVPEVRGGLHHGRHLGAGRDQGGGRRKQQRAAARHHDPPAGQHQTGLEHGLRAARGDHPGQGPAGEGQLPLVRAGGEQDGGGADGGPVLGVGTGAVSYTHL